MGANGEVVTAGAWLRRALLTFAVVCALLLPMASPGSGTAVNIDSSGDAAALVRADHHAKTLPTIAEIAIVLAVVAVAARLRRPSVAPLVAGVVDASGRYRAVGRCTDTGVLGRATCARRGPPVVL